VSRYTSKAQQAEKWDKRRYEQENQARESSTRLYTEYLKQESGKELLGFLSDAGRRSSCGENAEGVREWPSDTHRIDYAATRSLLYSPAAAEEARTQRSFAAGNVDVELGDVTMPLDASSQAAGSLATLQRNWDLAIFAACEWFERGWTLQEMLAPKPE